ncbi:Acid phosphatase [Aphelenchoides bicaudatus]|nr:Acid phosphatase [Aphelenchoides bicaudatus]
MLFAVLACLLISTCSAEYEEREFIEAEPVEADSDWKLVFIQALWRHGDRSPILAYTIPSDKLGPANWTKGGGGYGQLSPTGMNQHMLLGGKLRTRYNNTISPRYVANEVYIRSTDVNRTLLSAISNMVGFYPYSSAVPNEDVPNKFSQWPHFVPVPVHTVPEHWDPVLGVHNCSYERTVFEKLVNSTEWKKTVKDNQDLLNKVQKFGGFKNFTLDQIIGVRDTLFIEKTSTIDGIHMPDHFTEELFNQIDELAGVVDDLEDGINVAKDGDFDFSIELPKVTGGPLLWEIINHMQQKRACLDKTSKRTDDEQKACDYFDPLKYYAFSAHDSTISTLFSTFGFKESNFNSTGLPHYASCVTIELYQSTTKGTKDYKIKVLYWPELHGPWDVTHWVTGCDNHCSLDDFVNRSMPYKIDDMNAYCNPTPDNGAFSTNLAITSLLVVLLAMIFGSSNKRA